MCRCKCKLLWNVTQSYRKQSAITTQSTHASSKGLGRKKRISVPKLPLPVAPKQQDTVDGPNSGERSRSSSPNNRHAIRSKWLSSASSHLSFDYTKSQVKYPNNSSLPATMDSSHVNSMTDSHTSLGSREHIPKIVYHKSFQARIARNYYKLQHITLFVAFCINLLLLTAKVSVTCPNLICHYWYTLYSMMRQ